MNRRLFLWAVLLSSSSCASDKGPARINCIALIDFSRSVPSETFELYCETTGKYVISNLGQKDRLVVKPVDYSSEQRSEALFEIDLSQENFSRKSDGLKRRKEKEEARVQAFVTEKGKTFLPQIMQAKKERDRFAIYTDIVGALSAARTDLVPGPGAKNLIVIFSDMIHESAGLNLKSLQRGGSGMSLRMVEDLQRQNLVPDLKGVRIFVFGAGETPEVSGEYYRAVRSFWKEFFNRAGALFDEADYGYRNQERLRRVVTSMHESPGEQAATGK